MTNELLVELRERTAFKPKPPEYELALAHVPLTEAGLDDAVEQRVLEAMISEDESFVLITAPPGGGKSSLLAWSAWKAATSADGVVPVYVPVGHHTGKIDTSLLVRGAAEGLAFRLSPDLKSSDRSKLERALAITITTGRSLGRLRAGLTLPPLHGLTADVAGELGGDLTSVVKAGGWQGGPSSGLAALSDIARARRGRLVVIVEDTDIWSAGNPEMAERAGAFFTAMRSLVSCPDVTILAAVQTHWSESQISDPTQSQMATVAYRELSQRSSRVLSIPVPSSIEQARRLVRSVLERRMRITLEASVPDGGWCDLLFSPAAIDLLAKRCLSTTVRQVLTDVRDTFDRHDVLPVQISPEHIIEAMGA